MPQFTAYAVQAETVVIVHNQRSRWKYEATPLPNTSFNCSFVVCRTLSGTSTPSTTRRGRRLWAAQGVGEARRQPKSNQGRTLLERNLQRRRGASLGQLVIH